MKVAKHGMYANWHEFFISSALQSRNGPIANIVAEVRSISASGKYLIMERLTDIGNTATTICYPSWATDLKPENFGITSAGNAKLRDFGQTSIGWNLAQPTYVSHHNRPARTCIVPNGYDIDYEILLGTQIGTENDRTIHEVIGYPDHVMKRCTYSHRANQAELQVFHALHDIDADILDDFGVLECSRSGKHLIMQRLSDLPAHSTGGRPQFPLWLKDKSDACLGIDATGAVKIRTYKEIDLGDALSRANVLTLR
ncbi:hypothetical protein EHZ19_15905 [Paraburkholderia bannensis]|nr:hypothetical protein [Paraburkholderia bannensis]RQM47137.1 hypothetical protein EHZ19_15905 [Paraburkholderia bannensis]